MVNQLGLFSAAFFKLESSLISTIGLRKRKKI